MENAQLNKLTGILIKHGYQHIRSNTIKEAHQADLVLEWWTGPKGTIIVQHQRGDVGVQTFADWPTGNSFAEMEFALAAKSIKGNDRQLEVTGQLIDGEDGHTTIDIDHTEPDLASLKDAERRAVEHMLLVTSAQVIRTDWIINQKTTQTNLE